MVCAWRDAAVGCSSSWLCSTSCMSRVWQRVLCLHRQSSFSTTRCSSHAEASLTDCCSSRNLPPAGCSHFGGPEGAAKQHIASGQAAERALDIRAAAAAYEQVCSCLVLHAPKLAGLGLIHSRHCLPAVPAFRQVISCVRSPA